MPAPTKPPVTTANGTEIPRAKRGEGQWALGYTEPLNKNEQSKKDDNPLNVRDRILNIYSKRGFASIDPADLRGRFRWMGLYTQRAPGFDGGKTATLEEEELDDEYFMLRVRSDGALLTADAVRALGTSARRTPATPPTSPTARTSSTTGSGSRTSRRSGTSSTRPGWTPWRPAVTPRAPSSAPRSPASPRTRSSTAPRRWRRSSGATIGDPEFANLPRKFKTALTGHPSHDVDPGDQRRLLRRHGAPRARPRLRPVGRRRAVHQPDAGPEARRVDPARGGARRLGGGRLDRSATTATAGCARGPG